MTTLAHYGGIDEIAVFAIPALLAILAIRWAERRARQKRDREANGTDE
jgi:hypothetical protein